MLIDHLVHAAPGLPAAVADVEERFGVRARAGGRHIGLGTHNALLALGPQTSRRPPQRPERQQAAAMTALSSAPA